MLIRTCRKLFLRVDIYDWVYHCRKFENLPKAKNHLVVALRDGHLQDHYSLGPFSLLGLLLLCQPTFHCIKYLSLNDLQILLYFLTDNLSVLKLVYAFHYLVNIPVHMLNLFTAELGIWAQNSLIFS